jgi:hypothetical protein
MAKKKKADVEAPATNVVEAEASATETSPETATTLYFNENGSVECREHAPRKGTQTWKLDRWRKATEEDIEALKREFGPNLGCVTCAQPRVSEATDAAPPAKAGPERPKKNGRKTKADLTLGDLAERYVAHMEESGKSAGTSASYGLELKTALAALGADTKLADLTPEQVLAYFASARVLKKRNGKHKSLLSIAKTQRVLRLALVWAEGAKLIAKAPLPEALATH